MLTVALFRGIGDFSEWFSGSFFIVWSFCVFEFRMSWCLIAKNFLSWE